MRLPEFSKMSARVVAALITAGLVAGFVGFVVLVAVAPEVAMMFVFAVSVVLMVGLVYVGVKEVVESSRR